MEFIQDIWIQIKEFTGIYSITTKWNFDLDQNILSNFIRVELDKRYTDMSSIFKIGITKDKWVKLLQLNYHNKKYRFVHKRYIDSLLNDIDRNNGADNNFCAVYIFMNYVFTNIDDFRHQEWFMYMYKQKVYTLLKFYGEENYKSDYDILIDLLHDIGRVL